ncbi:hypothetical protein BDB01DRAFT_834520 [Pilobolus umbonatus]|nr:hypothetical protein BDB01DRAFT_834520 [Pilobolus umbonatus]
MSTSSAIIQPYSPIPPTMTVPTVSLESVIDAAVAKHGVRWIITTIRRAKKSEAPVRAEDGQLLRKKKTVDYEFVKYYACNRHGTFKKANNSGAVQRPVQKKSKKIGCPATLKVTCFKNDPDNVVIKHNGEHNHAVGSPDDLQHLPLSSSVRGMIEESLREGYTRRDTLINIQRSLLEEVNNASFVHRDQSISAEEVYNISRRAEMEFIKKAEDQRRERQIQAEAIPEIVAESMINDEQNGYSVLSFSLKDVGYSVVVEEGIMRSCKCQDFRGNAIACKHMYLLARVQDSIQVFGGEAFDDVVPVEEAGEVEAVPVEQVSRVVLETTEEDSIRSAEEVFPAIEDAKWLKSVLEAYILQPIAFSQENLRLLKQKMIDVESLLSGYELEDIAPNANLQRQRRQYNILL